MAWRDSTWGDEIDLKYGKAIKGYRNKTEGYRVYGSNGPIGYHDDFLAEGPGIILGRKGAYRGIEFCEEPFHVIDTAYYVIPKTDLNMRWLYYAMKYHRLGNIDDGSPIPSTTRSAVYVRPVLVPEKDEQDRIASALEALDDKIDLNRRMNATLEAQARALFWDWFVDFGPTRAKMAGATPYLPADLWALFPDTLGGGGLPKGWVHEPLSKHCRATRGLSYKGKHLTTSENGVQMYNLNSINEGGGIKASGMKYYDGPYKDRHAVEPGDLIMANTEQGFDHLLIGYSAIIDSPGISSHHLYAIRPLDCSGLTSQWLLYLFNCSPYGETVRRYSNGTTVNMLPADALSMPLIPVPPQSLVKAFTSVAQSSHDQINEARKLSERLAGVRDYLLPRLMSGETEVAA